MSLTVEDLQQIRTLVREEMKSTIAAQIDPRFDNLDGKLESLENDIKDIYEMISELQKLTRHIANFEKKDLEQKILASYKEIMSIAREAGIKLPQA